MDLEDMASLGQPVELGQIARELKALWESSAGAKSRASLVNFVVLSHGLEGLDLNTQIIIEFTRDHACRAVLIATDSEYPQPEVKAWINAHCHLSRAGASQVCCEQITILLRGSAEHLLTNVLFANLDSDLPLFLWWQGEFTDFLTEQLGAWVDRLIFDSRDWKRPHEQFALLARARQHAASRMILCDLNWTRTLHLRQALAQTYDHPEALAHIAKLTRLRITHAPDSHTTAVLFLAWIAAQLKWEPVRVDAPSPGNPAKVIYRSGEGAEVTAELIAAEGSPISRCELIADGFHVSVQREPGSAFHTADVKFGSGQIYHHLLPAGGESLLDLLDDELTFGGRHKVYLKALAAADWILGPDHPGAPRA